MRVLERWTMSDGLLTPDEEQQLQETLDFDPAKIESFLEQFFPDQTRRRKEAQAKAAALAGENLDYTITGEGPDWIEFEVEGRTIKLEREQYRGTGRRRANPYIDTRTVNQMSKLARAACYAVAAYKLRKDGEETASYIQKEAASYVRKNLFRGSDGLAALMHITQVCVAAMDKFSGLPELKNTKVEAVVTQALVSAVANAVGPKLEGS